MGKRINPATVGAFVLGAIGLVLAAVVVFGSGNLFRKTHEFVIYFAGDINGLRVGAPVKFKGVENITTPTMFLQFQKGEAQIVWPPSEATASFEPKAGWAT